MHHKLVDTGDCPRDIGDCTLPPCRYSLALSFSFLHAEAHTMFPDRSDLFLQTSIKILQAFPHSLWALHFLLPRNHCESRIANPLHSAHAKAFRCCDHSV